MVAPSFVSLFVLMENMFIVFIISMKGVLLHTAKTIVYFEINKMFKMFFLYKRQKSTGGLFRFFCTLIYCWFHVSISMLSLIFMSWSIIVSSNGMFCMQALFSVSSGDGSKTHFFFFSLLLFQHNCFCFQFTEQKIVCILFHTSAFNRTTLEPEHAATFALSGHSDRCTTLPSNVPTTLPEAITPGTQMSWLCEKMTDRE